MLDIFFQTLPFFAIIALGFGAGRVGFFGDEATVYLTKFVFYFALSAMLFRFAANLSFDALWQPDFLLAYLVGTGVAYVFFTVVAFIRGSKVEQAAFEAQAAVIGNVGFLGIPMMALLLGEAAVVPVMMVLAVDLLVFGSLIVLIVTAARSGVVSLSIFRILIVGLLKNPMLVSIGAGLAWSALQWPIPGPMNDALEILGNAATPGALFAIGASLAGRSADGLGTAAWLAFGKLVVHPAVVAITVLMFFTVDPYAAGVMIACAALPTAGNVYILAQHYGVAPARVSATILISTVISILTLTGVIAWVTTL